jgi:hypothetical protein
MFSRMNVYATGTSEKNVLREVSQPKIDQAGSRSSLKVDVPNQGATSYDISMDIRPILTPKSA